MSSSIRNTLLTMMAGAVAAVLVISLVGVETAEATHQPANKAAAAGSDIDQIEDAEPILSETFRVSSPEDIIIQVTTECSILTRLQTNNESANSMAFGSVRLWVEIDGHRVPVSTDDTAIDEDDIVVDDGDPTDIGEITFCNRAYERTVTDGENQPDGIDDETDYIRTRTANAFNWLALDTGFDYDEDFNGNNIITVELWADYDTATSSTGAGNTTAAEAFVGSRTMIIEPTRVSNHEQVAPADSGN